MKNPIFVALDVDTAERALQLAAQLKGLVGGFKIGPRLAVRYGADLTSRLGQFAPIFVDMKYLDIPSTMEAAVRATFAAGATWATIHCWSGAEAMKRLAQVEAELNRERPFQILAVTILTSFSAPTLPPPLNQYPISSQVETLATLAQQSGLGGVVCSAHELPLLNALPLFKVVPGIRMSNAVADDQVRTLSPTEAIHAGASALVIGRPIVEASDPVAVTEQILTSLRGA